MKTFVLKKSYDPMITEGRWYAKGPQYLPADKHSEVHEQ